MVGHSSSSASASSQGEKPSPASSRGRGQVAILKYTQHILLFLTRPALKANHFQGRGERIRVIKGVSVIKVHYIHVLEISQ
jgi:hypothetical protein